MASVETVLLDTQRDHIRIVFGGHFKSGKSTLLNGLIGRSVLPTGDLRETGAGCEIRSGWRNRGQSYRGASQLASFEPTAGAIKRWSSLVEHDGRQRRTSELADRIEIVLNTRAVPKGVVWVDSPGINDAAEMDQRAQEIARSADLLVWVLSSKACLSEPEMEFLARHTAHAKGRSVLLVLNCFLSEVSEQAWATFLKERVPVHLDRIKKFGPDLNLDESVLRGVIPVVAASMSGARDRLELRRTLVDTLATAGGVRRVGWLPFLEPKFAPAVNLSHAASEARCARLNATTEEVLAGLEKVAALEKSAFENAHRKHEAWKQNLQRRKVASDQISRAITDALAAFAATFTSEASSYADGIGRPLSRDDTYTNELRDLMRWVSANAQADLLTQIERALEHAGLEVANGPSLKTIVSKRMTAGTISISVPNNTVEGGTAVGGAAAGAAAGAAIGSFIPILGTAVGAIVGGLIGGAAGNDSAMEESLRQDHAGLRLNVAAAARQYVNSISGSRSALLSEVIASALPNEPPAVPAPSRSKLDALSAAIVDLKRAEVP